MTTKRELWRVTHRRHDGPSRPAADFTVSSDGEFIAAFASEQDAAKAVNAVNAFTGPAPDAALRKIAADMVAEGRRSGNIGLVVLLKDYAAQIEAALSARPAETVRTER